MEHAWQCLLVTTDLSSLAHSLLMVRASFPSILPIRCVRSFAGKRVVTASEDATVRVWNPQTAQPIHILA